MSVQTVLTPTGIPVRYNDRNEPLFSGLRRTLGLKVEGKEEVKESAVPVAEKLPRRIPIFQPPTVAMGSVSRSGTGRGHRRLMRGC